MLLRIISQVDNYKNNCKKPNNLEAWCYNLCAKVCEILKNNLATNNIGWKSLFYFKLFIMLISTHPSCNLFFSFESKLIWCLTKSLIDVTKNRNGTYWQPWLVSIWKWGYRKNCFIQYKIYILKSNDTGMPVNTRTVWEPNLATFTYENSFIKINI